MHVLVSVMEGQGEAEPPLQAKTQGADLSKSHDDR